MMLFPRNIETTLNSFELSFMQNNLCNNI